MYFELLDPFSGIPCLDVYTAERRIIPETMSTYHSPFLRRISKVQLYRAASLICEMRTERRSVK